MGREDQGVAASRHRYHVVPRTLCFVRHGDEVLLQFPDVEVAGHVSLRWGRVAAILAQKPARGSAGSRPRQIGWRGGGNPGRPRGRPGIRVRIGYSGATTSNPRMVAFASS